MRHIGELFGLVAALECFRLALEMHAAKRDIANARRDEAFALRQLERLGAA